MRCHLVGCGYGEPDAISNGNEFFTLTQDCAAREPGLRKLPTLIEHFWIV
jgi:hypothetical protein